MFKTNIFKSRVISLGLIGAFLLLVNPPSTWAQASGSLSGIVYEENFETPIKDAVVKIRNVDTGTEYESQPTNDKGQYEIAGITEGRYVLGISTNRGNYNYDFELFIKGNEKGKLNLAIEPGIIGAALAKKAKGFFPIVAGALIAVVGAITAGVIISGNEETTTVSKIKK